MNFEISGKVISLPKVIKYVKRSKYSFHDFSAKHTPSATLNLLAITFVHIGIFLYCISICISELKLCYTYYDEIQHLAEYLTSSSGDRCQPGERPLSHMTPKSLKIYSMLCKKIIRVCGKKPNLISLCR